MKRLLFFIISLFIFSYAKAGHIAGGEIFYKYLGKGVAANSSNYRITLRLFRECNPLQSGPSVPAQLPPDLYMGIYTNANPSVQIGGLVHVFRKGNIQVINKTTYNNCLANKPEVCYQIGYYEFDQELPDTPEGYVIGYQTCCRSFSIVNVEFFPLNSGGNTISGEGATYSCVIPGTNVLGTETNSSPECYVKDTSLVCAGDKFTLDFSAFDPDSTTYGDSLSYSLCSAFNRGNTTYAADTSYVNPPYVNVTYNAPFSGDFPLGANASINPTTGIISGIAPPSGSYVVNVCITEWRNGKVLGVHRKDFTLKVSDCALQAVELRPVYNLCDSFTFKFYNLSPPLTQTNIVNYLWSFNDSLSTPDSNTSNLSTPIHIYKDTGAYNLSVTVTASGGCQDSAKSIVKVYPGFKAGFKISGSCIHTPYTFIDTSYSKYGTINSWSWDLGETTVTNDTFSVKDTSYTYPTVGQKTVTLIVANTNGCMDTAMQVLNVKPNPVLIHTPDTLICNTDTLQLSASEQNGSGNETFSWTSTDSIINPNSPNPLVYPKDTAIYYIKLIDQGCSSTDSVIIRTVHFVTVKAYPDTSICKTDSIRLYLITNDSNGGDFTWTSSSGEKVAPIKNPTVKPLVDTKYYVLVNLDNKCFARDTTSVTVHLYPFANAGVNDSICFGDSIRLLGNIVGDKFKWASLDSSFVDSTNITTYVAPDSTTSYVLTAHYLGINVCPKPVSDTITIAVIPKIVFSVGDDTVVVANEPLKIKATGNVDSTNADFIWTTLYGSTYLTNDFIYNPIATIPLGVDSMTYFVEAILKNPKQCFAKDTLKVLVYQTPPEIFVPTAFTPDAGINNIEKPIPVGILHLDFFSIYNRFGQLLYTTSQIGQGWDGTFNGAPQPPGTYVFVAQGVDYLGKPIGNKGTVVLIR